MKRSLINEIMAEADEMIRSYGVALPPWAYWAPAHSNAIDGSFHETGGGSVMRDGILHGFQPGTALRLAPVESVTLMPGDWHGF